MWHQIEFGYILRVRKVFSLLSARFRPWLSRINRVGVREFCVLLIDPGVMLLDLGVGAVL